MPKFRITLAVSVRRIYEVEADDADDAAEQDFRGDDPVEEYDVRDEILAVDGAPDPEPDQAEGPVTTTTIPSHTIFVASDGFRLRWTGTEWTDGDLTFTAGDHGRPLDSEGQPVSGELVIPLQDAVEAHDGQTVCPECLVGNGDGLSEWSVDALASLVDQLRNVDPALLDRITLPAPVEYCRVGRPYVRSR